MDKRKGFPPKQTPSAHRLIGKKSPTADGRIFMGKETAMNRLCDARQLVHYVIDKRAKEGRPVSNLQLQKTMYFLQSVYCSVTGFLLFSEETHTLQRGNSQSGKHRKQPWRY